MRLLTSFPWFVRFCLTTLLCLALGAATAQEPPPSEPDEKDAIHIDGGKWPKKKLDRTWFDTKGLSPQSSTRLLPSYQQTTAPISFEDICATVDRVMPALTHLNPWRTCPPTKEPQIVRFGVEATEQPAADAEQAATADVSTNNRGSDEAQVSKVADAELTAEEIKREFHRIGKQLANLPPASSNEREALEARQEELLERLQILAEDHDLTSPLPTPRGFAAYAVDAARRAASQNAIIPHGESSEETKSLAAANQEWLNASVEDAERVLRRLAASTGFAPVEIVRGHPIHRFERAVMHTDAVNEKHDWREPANDDERRAWFKEDHAFYFRRGESRDEINRRFGIEYNDWLRQMPTTHPENRIVMPPNRAPGRWIDVRNSEWLDQWQRGGDSLRTIGGTIGYGVSWLLGADEKERLKWAELGSSLDVVLKAKSWRPMTIDQPQFRPIDPVAGPPPNRAPANQTAPNP